MDALKNRGEHRLNAEQHGVRARPIVAAKRCLSQMPVPDVPAHIIGQLAPGTHRFQIPSSLTTCPDILREKI